MNTQLDYYAILQVDPNANASEIKKAFHLLAQRHHPDKQSSQVADASAFTTILEAYKVLSDPKKRKVFHATYFPFRSNNFTREEKVTAAMVVEKSERWKAKVFAADPFRSNFELLAIEMKYVLSPAHIALLREKGTIQEIELFTEKLASCFHLIPYDSMLIAWAILKELNFDNKEKLGAMEKIVKYCRRQQQWEMAKPYIVLIIALVLCLLIFLL